MQILVTGCTGYVGGMISRHLAQGHTVFGTSDNCEPDETHFLCDLRHPEAVAALAEQIQPDAVIHAAGVKNIAFCEKNPEAAMATNCSTTINLSRVFGERSLIVYVSTDYVFDGRQGGYSELDTPEPSTHYGQSKLAGEREGLLAAPSNFVIVRTAALYDFQATFLKFLFSKLSNGERIDCFSDIIYSPTYCADFLVVIEKITQGLGKQKIYHVCGQPTSRYAFARCFAEAFGFDPLLIRLCSYRSRKQQNLFLFPNLSLNKQDTQVALSICMRSHRQALFELARQQVAK